MSWKSHLQNLPTNEKRASSWFDIHVKMYKTFFPCGTVPCSTSSLKLAYVHFFTFWSNFNI